MKRKNTEARDTQDKGDSADGESIMLPSGEMWGWEGRLSSL